MDKVIVIPDSLYNTLHGFTKIYDCLCGALFCKTYKSSKGNYFVFSYYVTGVGLLDKPIVNPKKDEVVQKFLSLNKDYKKLNFQTHSAQVKKYHGGNYESFLDGLDAQLILVPKEAGNTDEVFIIEDGYTLQIDNWEMGRKDWKKFNTYAKSALEDIETVMLFS